jgi:hypothetical protein
MDFLTLLQQYMSVEAVLIAIGLTQAIKYMLPTPEGQPRSKVMPIVNRFLPFAPLIIATLTVIVKDHIVCNGAAPMAWDDAIIKGMISGFAAAYLYRTAQVSLFGK